VVSINITDNNGRIPLRSADFNIHLHVTRLLLSNYYIVHIARKCNLTALLAAVESGHVEASYQLLKNRACVFTGFTKYSELLKAAAVKIHRRRRITQKEVYYIFNTAKT